MAGIVTHLAVADKILDITGEDGIKHPDMFFCGSIAPDAIHSKEDYVREDKKRTHLRDGIRDCDFLNKENQIVFHKRVEQFCDKFIYSNNRDADLYKGYIVHVLTDELFFRTVRAEISEMLEKGGLILSGDNADREAFLRFQSDMDNIDLRLAREYPFIKNVREELYKEWSYKIDGYITKDWFNSSKWWVCDRYFDNNSGFAAPLYYRYERCLNFIDEAAVKLAYIF